MFRVLEWYSILILTLSISKSYLKEYVDDDIYELNVNKVNNKVFFQRVYNEKSITERLLNNLKRLHYFKGADL